MFYSAASCHENFIMAVDTSNKTFPTFPKYEHNLPNELVCTAAIEDCWFNKCPNCKDAQLLRRKFLPEQVESSTVTWHVWGNDADGKLCKMVKEGTSNDLFSHVCAVLAVFLQHCFTKRTQAESCLKEREGVGGDDFDEHLLCCKLIFSENYTCMLRYYAITVKASITICMRR